MTEKQFSTNDVIIKHAGNYTLTKLPVLLVLPQTHSVQQTVCSATLRGFQNEIHVAVLWHISLYRCTAFDLCLSNIII